MGGLLGEITLASADLSPFWAYLWLGQWTHAGKGTSMGLGKYRIEATLTQQFSIAHGLGIYVIVVQLGEVGY